MQGTARIHLSRFRVVSDRAVTLPSPEQIEQIVAEDMPAYRVVHDHVPSRAQGETTLDETSPELSEIQRHYATAPEKIESEEPSPGELIHHHLMVVVTRRLGEQRPKVVVVSGKTGTIISAQG